MKTILAIFYNWIAAITKKTDIDYSNFKFKEGQKAFVWYYNIYYNWVNVFQPPKCGVIVGLGNGQHRLNDCDYDFNGISSTIYWKVNFGFNTFDIPEQYIIDLVEHINSEEQWLKSMDESVYDNKYSKGEIEATIELKNSLIEAKKFLLK